jgi:hypothetical protein
MAVSVEDCLRWGWLEESGRAVRRGGVLGGEVWALWSMVDKMFMQMSPWYSDHGMGHRMLGLAVSMEELFVLRVPGCCPRVRCNLLGFIAVAGDARCVEGDPSRNRCRSRRDRGRKASQLLYSPGVLSRRVIRGDLVTSVCSSSSAVEEGVVLPCV